MGDPGTAGAVTPPIEAAIAGALDASFMRSVSADARRDLLAAARLVELEPGAIPFASGDRPPRGGIVVDGLARTFIQAADGRRLSIRYVRRGALAGLAAGLAAERSPISVQAITRVRLLELPRPAVEAVARRDAAFAWALAGEVSDRLIDSIELVARTTFGTLRDRIAAQLLELADVEADGTLAVHGTQQDLADAVGSVREVVARVLGDLRDEGLLRTAPGRVAIVDPAGLVAQVGGWRTRPA